MRDDKLQYGINIEVEKISTLSSNRINKYEYFTDKETLTSDQRIILEQAKFVYSALGKAFEKQLKTIKYQGEKQIKVIEEHRKQLSTSNNFIKKYDCDTEKR